MPIDLTCTNCSKKLRIADTSAGKQVRCPACRTILPVPTATPPGYAEFEVVDDELTLASKTAPQRNLDIVGQAAPVASPSPLTQATPPPLPQSAKLRTAQAPTDNIFTDTDALPAVLPTAIPSRSGKAAVPDQAPFDVVDEIGPQDNQSLNTALASQWSTAGKGVHYNFLAMVIAVITLLSVIPLAFMVLFFVGGAFLSGLELGSARVVTAGASLAIILGPLFTVALCLTFGFIAGLKLLGDAYMLSIPETTGARKYGVRHLVLLVAIPTSVAIIYVLVTATVSVGGSLLFLASTPSYTNITPGSGSRGFSFVAFLLMTLAVLAMTTMAVVYYLWAISHVKYLQQIGIVLKHNVVKKRTQLLSYLVRSFSIAAGIGIAIIYLQGVSGLFGVFLPSWMVVLMLGSLMLLLFGAFVAGVVVYLLAASTTRDAMIRKANSILGESEA